MAQISKRFADSGLEIQAVPDSPDARNARAAEAGAAGLSGATPSNTATDNSNFHYKPLRWGIDSLYLSYPGELSVERLDELQRLKKLAQGPDHEAAKAQILLDGHVFEVKDKSTGMFAFTLVDDAYMIRLSAGKSKKLPMAFVQIGSRYLAHKSPQATESELRAILRSLGAISPPKVSRVDLYIDFASTVNMEEWNREAWVTKARAVNQYADGKDFTGWTIGGGDIMCRLYNKLIELKKSGKEYLLDLWVKAGWLGIEPVWRLEFEFKREVLQQLGLDDLPSVMDSLAGLWSYATNDWLRLCLPNDDDKTRSRWPAHPLWQLLSSVDWAQDGGPMLRTYRPVRAPSLEWLGVRLAALIASLAAVLEIVDFDEAVDEAMNHAFAALSNQNGLSGISTEQFFQEKVEALTREYNLRMNPPPKDPPEPYVRNEYERQSRGY